jgi:arylsulfatase A-like enzyme
MPGLQLSRRSFVGGLALAAGAAAVTPLLRRSSKRNVILIISDSMRRDALECFGGDWIDTPNLNALAVAGVRFTNAFVCSFPTVLARHDILTGTLTFTYKGWSPLVPSTLTLPQVLSTAGVYTMLVADTPYPYTEEYGYHRCFQRCTLVRGQGNDHYVTQSVPVRFPCKPSKLWEPHEDVVQYLRNTSNQKVEEDYFCARTMRLACDWLQRNQHRQPFFLCVDTFDPHEPWDAPSRYVKEYDPEFHGMDIISPRYEQWRRFLTKGELKHCRALYAAEATMVDHWLGRLLDTIERLGLYENSLVLFISDHGLSLGEHGLIGKGVKRNGLLQNCPLYPELCRIPCIARFPGCPAGTCIDALIQPVNLAATITDFMGLEVPAEFTGGSAWPVMQGKEPSMTELAVSAPNISPELKRKFPRPTDRPSITDGRWLLVYSCAGWGDELGGHSHNPGYHDRRRAPLTGEALDPMLFDLDADPDCLRNIYANNKEAAANLHRGFCTFLQKSPMRRDHIEYFRSLENS